jgi:hypothetical protein
MVKWHIKNLNVYPIYTTNIIIHLCFCQGGLSLDKAVCIFLPFFLLPDDDDYHHHENGGDGVSGDRNTAWISLFVFFKGLYFNIKY